MGTEGGDLDDVQRAYDKFLEDFSIDVKAGTDRLLFLAFVHGWNVGRTDG